MNIFAYICIMESLCCTPETNTIINHYYKSTILQKKGIGQIITFLCARTHVCVSVCVLGMER